MKKLFIIPVIAVLTFACNSGDKKHDHATKKEGPASLTDSLISFIDDAHHVGMSKIGAMHKLRERMKTAVDSIEKLPAKTKAAAAAYLDRLKSAIGDIDYADMAMDKWMMEYDEDSVKENLEARIKYLTDEKLKVGKMKEAVVNSMQKADSLLREKF